MVQQNYQEDTTNSKNPTLRREHTVKRENLSGESHGDGQSFDLKKQKDETESRKDF